MLAVYGGAVEIRPAASDQSVVVSAGQQTRFSAQAIEPLAVADPARQAWCQGQLLAMDQPLEEVVAELGRYTHMHIGVAPAVAQRRVFGTFPLNDVEGTLELLAEAAQLRVRRTLPWWVTLEPVTGPSVAKT
jgi:transmembrane sensor